MISRCNERTCAGMHAFSCHSFSSDIIRKMLGAFFHPFECWKCCWRKSWCCCCCWSADRESAERLGWCALASTADASEFAVKVDAVPASCGEWLSLFSIEAYDTGSNRNWFCCCCCCCWPVKGRKYMNSCKPMYRRLQIPLLKENQRGWMTAAQMTQMTISEANAARRLLRGFSCSWSWWWCPAGIRCWCSCGW